MNFLLSKRMRYFIVTMEEKSITRAAEILCITRSPLGKVICDLEERLDGKLFIRKYNTLEATPLAVSLYKKIKPIHDTLAAIEDDLSHKSKNIKVNLIFDVSMPYNIYKYYISILESEGMQFTHHRIFVTPEIMAHLKQAPSTIIFSFRGLSDIEGNHKVVLSTDYLSILVPEKVNHEHLCDPDYMHLVPVLIKSSPYIEQIKNCLSFSLKNHLPFLHFQEVDSDLFAMLYTVAHGSAIVVLPESMADIYQIKGVKKITFRDIIINKTVYHNLQKKELPIFNKIIEIIEDLA
ncbi:LysR family transcriptional regulator [Hafnia paralvei]|nr:LysR family transcriptional regulator [Hafnia paralvei]